MAFKFSVEGSSYAASIKDGIITVYFNKTTLEIPVPTIKSEFSKQAWSFNRSEILAYFEDDKECLVLRMDGTFSRYLRKCVADMTLYTLIGFGKWEPKVIEDVVSIIDNGMLIYKTERGATRSYNLELVVPNNSDEYGFSVGINHFPMILRIADNPQLFDDYRAYNSVLPALHFVADGKYMSPTYGYEVIGQHQTNRIWRTI